MVGTIIFPASSCLAVGHLSCLRGSRERREVGWGDAAEHHLAGRVLERMEMVLKKCV